MSCYLSRAANHLAVPLAAVQLVLMNQFLIQLSAQLDSVFVSFILWYHDSVLKLEHSSNIYLSWTFQQVNNLVLVLLQWQVTGPVGVLAHIILIDDAHVVCR